MTDPLIAETVVSKINTDKHLIENAYNRGYRDFRHGKERPDGSTTVADNPFGHNSLFAKEWERGFNAAYFANIKYLQTKTNFFLPRKKKKIK